VPAQLEPATRHGGGCCRAGCCEWSHAVGALCALAGLAFAEELLPGLDIIPTATIAWALENTEFGRSFADKAPPTSKPSSSGWPWEQEAPPSKGTDAGMKSAKGSVVDDK
jgi:hypothetical protein